MWPIIGGDKLWRANTVNVCGRSKSRGKTEGKNGRARRTSIMTCAGGVGDPLGTALLASSDEASDRGLFIFTVRIKTIGKFFLRAHGSCGQSFFANR